MKDINEVLRRKETELQQLQREVEALRITTRLLNDEADTAATAYGTRPSTTVANYVPPARPPQPPVTTASDAGYTSPSWDAASKKFP